MESFDGSKDAKDKLMAAVVRDGLLSIERFNKRRRILSEARFLGRRYGVILWHRRPTSLAGTEEMDWYVPYHIQDVDRRRFHWVTDWDNETRQTKTGTHLEMFNTNAGRWERLAPELEGSIIQYTYGDTEDRVGYGRGLLEAIYFYHYLKTVTFEKVSQGIDRWANGVWTGRIDSLRGSSTDKTNEDLRQGMKTMLETMRTEHVAVLQDGDEINIHETTGSGHQISMDFMRYLDEGVERLCNGSLRGSGHAQESGARAQAEVESDTSESFFQDDREDLDAILTRDLVGAFLRVNRPQIERLGLARARLPRLTSEQIKRQDPKLAVEVMNAALARVPLLRHEYYAKIEMTEPAEGDDVIEAQAAFSDFGIGIGQPGGGGPPGSSGKKPFGGKPEKEEPEESEEEKQEEQFAQFQASLSSSFDSLNARLNSFEARFATPPQKPQEIHVHNESPKAPQMSFQLPDKIQIPAPEVNVKVEAPNVHVSPPQVTFSPRVEVQAAQAQPINVHVPQQAAPIVQNDVHVPRAEVHAHFQAPAQPAPIINIDDSKSASALEKLAGLAEKALGWFMRPKPDKKLTFETDEHGRLKSATQSEKKG